MDRYLLLTIVLLFSAGGAYIFLNQKPCVTPIPYAIGAIDEPFGLSVDALASATERAVRVWEQSVGKDLFVYDPRARLKIELRYDDRQRITEEVQERSVVIDETSGVAESVKQEYERLRQEYEAAQRAYAEAATRFLSDQAAYNRRVAYWNKKGGAPKPEYSALEAEKEELLLAQSALEIKRQTVNTLADAVNAHVSRYNLLVAAINTNVTAINTNALAGTSFEEGVYASDREGERIIIYQFEDTIDLVRVLAHELGHALSLPHNDNPDSIMNPINQSDMLTLSTEDLHDIRTRCAIE